MGAGGQDEGRDACAGRGSASVACEEQGGQEEHDSRRLLARVSTLQEYAILQREICKKMPFQREKRKWGERWEEGERRGGEKGRTEG